MCIVLLKVLAYLQLPVFTDTQPCVFKKLEHLESFANDRDRVFCMHNIIRKLTKCSLYRLT